MTRVMFWNLNNFGSAAYFPANSSRKRKGDPDPSYGESTSANATERRDLVRTLVNGVSPHIFVIVEVKPGLMNLNQGDLVHDNAAERMRCALNHQAWGLVPPIATGTGGRAEGVAVFYKRANLQFLGPWRWTGATTEAPPRVGAAYGGRWTTSLPDRMINNAAWPNNGQQENHLGGQWNFVTGGVASEFPAAGFRRPWLVQFGERGGAGRVISILAFHAPPNQTPPPFQMGLAPLADAVAGTAALSTLDFFTTPNAQNEVRCVAGDFNVSVFDNVNDPHCYALLRAQGFQQEISTTAAGGGQVPDTAPFRGYLATHLREKTDASPYISVGNTAFGYPGFGSMSRTSGFGGGRYDSIDNFFTRGAPGPTHRTIVNPLNGSPYTVVNPPPAPLGAADVGGIHLNSQISNPNIFAFNPPAHNGIDDTADQDGSIALEYREWKNFGLIRSVSDHLPIAVDL